jgi:hypothetical protein
MKTTPLIMNIEFIASRTYWNVTDLVMDCQRLCGTYEEGIITRREAVDFADDVIGEHMENIMGKNGEPLNTAPVVNAWRKKYGQIGKKLSNDLDHKQ